MSRLFAVKIQVSKVPGLVHFKRRFGGPLRCGRYGLPKIDKLLVALMLVKRSANVRCRGKNFVANPQLCHFELCRCDSFAHWQQQKVDELLQQIDLGSLTRKSPLEGEDRVLQ